MTDIDPETPRQPVDITPDQMIRGIALQSSAMAWSMHSAARFDLNNLPPTVIMTARRFAEYIETGRDSGASMTALQVKIDLINEALREAGIEYPLGAAGVRDLASMANGRLEDLQNAQAEQQRLHDRVTELEEALRQILHGTWHSGNPGYEAAQTGWIAVSTVDGWREVLAGGDR
jgi:hypothetical protein